MPAQFRVLRSIGRASGVFANTVKVDDLKPFIGPGNPPLIISRVHYGRVIVVTATASTTSQELAIALKAQCEAAVSGKVTLDVKYKNLIDSAECRVYAIGATMQTLPNALTNPVADLDSVYQAGLALSVQNPGAPIAFTARHLVGGTLAHNDLVADYIQPVRAVAGNVDRSYEVWDGNGGGSVDTGIDVAPNDAITISASGQSWAGVAFTGTNGPDGWPGWAAGSDAPLEGANAHALIGHFGNGGWFRIGDFWSGTNDNQATGRLQLNINDNNPYNGDQNKRFQVRVQVVLKPAAAAAVYV